MSQTVSQEPADLAAVLGKLADVRPDVEECVGTCLNPANDGASIAVCLDAGAPSRQWLVSRPGEGTLKPMDEAGMRAYGDAVAAQGGTLVKVTVKGSGPEDMAVSLTRLVGGIVEGPGAAVPAVMRATPKGTERAYFSGGSKLDTPEETPGLDWSSPAPRL